MPFMGILNRMRAPAPPTSLAAVVTAAVLLVPASAGADVLVDGYGSPGGPEQTELGPPPEYPTTTVPENPQVSPSESPDEYPTATVPSSPEIAPSTSPQTPTAVASEPDEPNIPTATDSGSPGGPSDGPSTGPREVSGGSLPFTGLEVGFVALLGASLLLAGFVVRRFGRPPSPVTGDPYFG